MISSFSFCAGSSFAAAPKPSFEYAFVFVSRSTILNLSICCKTMSNYINELVQVYICIHIDSKLVSLQGGTLLNLIDYGGNFPVFAGWIFFFLVSQPTATSYTLFHICIHITIAGQTILFAGGATLLLRIEICELWPTLRCLQKQLEFLEI